jgi:integrase
MAWPDPLPGGGWRGGYRDSAGAKRYVKDSAGKTVKYGRKSDARSAANEKEVEARRQAASPETVIAKSTTWGEWWDQIAPKRRRADTDTDRTERDIVEKYLRPKWGSVPLNRIIHAGSDETGCQEWVTDVLSPGRAPSYSRRIWGVFSSSISYAVEKKVLTANPCAGIKLPKLRKRAKPFMDDAHVESLGEALDAQYRDMAEFDRETGLRPGEVCGLHADQLDLDGGWVTATNVYVSRKRVIRPWPKDGDARRVPLTLRAVEIARRQLGGRDLRSGCGMPHSDGSKCRSVLVFLSPTGLPVNPRTFAVALERAADRAEVDHRSPYAARRGFATWAARGVDAFELAELMGHEDIDQTREYVQQTPEARGRLLAARGEHVPLKLVSGADGAGAGANPDKSGQDDVEREGNEKTS